MKSNLPDPAPLPRLTPAEALKQDGYYFVTSSIMPEVEEVGTGRKAVPVCLMLIADGKMFICNPTQELPLDQMAKGLIFEGPLNPGITPP